MIGVPKQNKQNKITFGDQTVKHPLAQRKPDSVAFLNCQPNAAPRHLFPSIFASLISFNNLTLFTDVCIKIIFQLYSRCYHLDNSSFSLRQKKILLIGPLYHAVACCPRCSLSGLPMEDQRGAFALAHPCGSF